MCVCECYVNIFTRVHTAMSAFSSFVCVCVSLYLYVYTCVHRSTDIYHTRVLMYTCNYL